MVLYLIFVIFGTILTVIGAYYLFAGEEPTGIVYLAFAVALNLIGGLLKRRSKK